MDRMPSERLVAAAATALFDADTDAFESMLHREILSDGFSILLEPSIEEGVAHQLGTDDVSEWILRPLTWDIREYGPAKALGPADTFLLVLWQDLEGRLQRKFDSLFRRTTVADRGAILCFFGVAGLSIIVEYKRAPGGPVRLRPIAVVPAPRGLFELTDILLAAATPEHANALKAAVLSVDKIVYQRGLLVHVDRQREDIFGPSIDTVVLAELLVASLVDTDARGVAALEIGAGSGLLTTALASSDAVSSVTAVDVNPASISCTLKNLQVNGTELNANRPVMSIRGEQFSANSFVTPFDVVVCNPPYIPEPDAKFRGVKDSYATAVGGLELCEHILRNIDSLLTETGRLLFMTSSTSEAEVARFLPAGFRTTPAYPGALRVPLDVDSVWRNREWQRELLEDGRIERDDRGVLWHRLEPVWIERGR
jgi:tRNA1(Val) A37 N6-methylase TrmN6